MALSRIPSRTPVLIGTLMLLGGGLLAIAYSNSPAWWAAWIAPAPALAAMLLSPQPWRIAVGLTVGLLAGALSFDYRVVTGSATAALVIAAAYALAWASTLRLAATVAERWNAVPAVLVLPTAWAAIDTLLIHLSPHGSIGSIAYSQGGMLPVLQLASLGGVPAVTFLVLLPGSAAGLMLARLLGGAAVHRVTQAAGVAAAMTATALLFGLVRLDMNPTLSGPSVAMVAADRTASTRRDWSGFLAAYGTALDRAARPGVTVLLPEAVLRVDTPGLSRASAALTSLARERDATIVVGVMVDDGRVSTNRALVASSDGTAATYVKQHLVPGLERGLTPGRRDLVLGAPVPGTGIAICKDMHFPTLGRSYALAGARLMLVPAYDFKVDDRLMMTVAAVRGIEGGYSVARAARWGISSMSDPYGRVLTERRSGEEASTLTARAPLALMEPPLYSRVGDLFGWLCALAWLGLATRRKLLRPARWAVAA
jgi:apolipoprotein N-acyltransferase